MLGIHHKLFPVLHQVEVFQTDLPAFANHSIEH